MRSRLDTAGAEGTETLTERGRDLVHLERTLESAEGAERVGVLAEIAWLTRSTDPEKAVRAAAEACRFAEDDPEVSPAARARALLTLTWSNALEGETDLARSQLAGAQALLEDSGAPASRADVHLAAGHLELTAGQPGNAVPALERALDLYGKATDAVGQRESHAMLGTALFHLGDVDRAGEHFEQSERLTDSATPPADLASVQLNLAAIRYRKGDLTAALRGIQKSIAGFGGAGDSKGVGMAQANLSRIYRDLGEREKALDLILSSLEAVRDAGDRVAEARILAEVARTHLAVDAKEEALEAARESLAISREIDRPYSEAEALDALGNVYMSLGRDEEALESLRRALEVNRATGNRKGEGDCLYLIGELLLRTGDTDGAGESLEASLAAHREQGNRRGEGWALLSIGILKARCGEREGALRALEEADAIAKSLDYKSLTVRTGQEITDLHSSAGRFEEAFDSHQRYRAVESELSGERSEARIRQIKSLHEAERSTAARELRELGRHLVDRLEDTRRALESHAREDLERGLEDALSEARRILSRVEDLLS
jgi:tetratricopeptide (TPR) repeat protein